MLDRTTVPHLQFCPVSKEARTQQWPHGARAATVTTKRAERKKTKKKKKEEKKKREGKRGVGCVGEEGTTLHLHSSTKCQLLNEYKMPEIFGFPVLF